MSIVAWVDDIDRNSASQTGPKMANLGELRAAGLAVPRGFAATTDAYREVVGAPEVTRAIDTILADADPDDERRLGELAHLVREVIKAAPIPTIVADQIGDAYESLCAMCGIEALPTAVRSSATGEDAADASFAGQFDSYLGITGRDNVIESVRSCWASLFTERGVVYRLQRNISYLDCPMAVGVLELIDARASGIAFSIHPVTGKSDRIVMEGSWGWGEAIVGGLVVPDRAEVGKSDNRILDYVVANKLVMSQFDRERGAVSQVPVPESKQRERSLSDVEVMAISSSVREIEQHFGHAVDVEWVASEGPEGEAAITIVQARPETVHSSSSESTATWDPAGYALKYAFGETRDA